MKKLKLVSVLLIFALCTADITVLSADRASWEAVLNDTAEYVYREVKKPEYGSIGGEWAVLGLARCGYSVPEEYYREYYEGILSYVKEQKGVLHQKKYTEYSRLILALTAIGKNPSDVSGCNLLLPLGDYENTVRQGLNGPVWALLALDSKNYEIPINPDAKVQATREMYINRILERQNRDGGWSLYRAESGDTVSDVDITAMAIQALSKYQDNENVRLATEKALLCMSERQNENGGFSSQGAENLESCAQMLVALCEMGISFEDERFVKNGNTITDSLLTYYEEGNGFNHTLDKSGSSMMATEQALYALAALKRFADGKNSLYDMRDAITVAEVPENTEVPEEELFEKSFKDIEGHENQKAIEALAQRGIIKGKTEDIFEPDGYITRAELAAVIVRALGLTPTGNVHFSDVSKGDWFFESVCAAYESGIIKGVSENRFNPNGILSREEAAVMITRTAKKCGIDTELEAVEIRDTLAAFTDYVKAADWAQSSLAFCYSEEILLSDAMEIEPGKPMSRGEIAQMLFRALETAEIIR